jgi:urocanate hydratase
MKSIVSYLFITCCAVNLLAVNAWTTDIGTKKTPSHESVRGYLVDTVCVREEATQLAQLGSKHTKKCLEMPTCRQSGYALLLPSSDVLHFDKRGNELTSKLVKGHKAENGWLLLATGKRSGDQFAVATLEFVSKSRKK